MIKHLDDAVQLLTNKLRKLGIDKNTVIVFTSDNGGIPKTSQAPLRGFKGCFYDGGIRVPTFIHYPGGVKGSTDVPVINLDYYPTFIEIAGGKLPADKILDGESLLPIVTGKARELKRQSIFWHFPGYLDAPCPGGRDTIFRQRPTTMIRKGDWKLMLYHEEWVLDGGRAKIDTNHSVELFNLREDVSEKHELANMNKIKRDELLDDLLLWMKDTNAQMAVKFNDQNRFTQKEIEDSRRNPRSNVDMEE
jgi:arylsulfatase A-like enzyme